MVSGCSTSDAMHLNLENQPHKSPILAMSGPPIWANLPDNLWLLINELLNGKEDKAAEEKIVPVKERSESDSNFAITVINKSISHAVLKSMQKIDINIIASPNLSNDEIYNEALQQYKSKLQNYRLRNLLEQRHQVNCMLLSGISAFTLFMTICSLSLAKLIATIEKDQSISIGRNQEWNSFYNKSCYDILPSSVTCNPSSEFNASFVLDCLNDCFIVEGAEYTWPILGIIVGLLVSICIIVPTLCRVADRSELNDLIEHESTQINFLTNTRERMFFHERNLISRTLPDKEKLSITIDDSTRTPLLKLPDYALVTLR